MTVQEQLSPAGPARAADWSVAFMVHRFPLVSETFVATLAAAMIPHVRDFRILATDGEVAPEPHQEIVAQAGLLERLHVSPRQGRIPVSRMTRLASEAPGRLPHLVALGLLGRVAPPSKMALTRMLARQPAFDIVHCQFGYEGLAALRHRRFGTLRTRALISHFRGSDITRHVREAGESVYDDLFRDADHFIANCAFFRDRAIELGCDPERISVVGSPIDTQRFAPPEQPRAPPGGRPVRLVAVGRLVEKKGFADVIAALARLRHGDAVLDILGDGPLRTDLVRQARDAGLADRVTFHGAATGDAVLRALHRADIGLAPSVTAADGDADAPVNTLKEMMATGLPVVATRHGGIPELVIPNENGALVPEHDPAALAGAIDALVDAPECWQALGAAGRAKVVDAYGLDRVLKRTFDTYERALAHAEHARRRS